MFVNELLKFLPIVNYENDSDGGAPDAAEDASKPDAEAEALAEVNKEINGAENDLYNDDGSAKKPEDAVNDDKSDKDDNDDKSDKDDDKKDEPVVSKNGVEKPEDLKTVPEDGKYYIEIPEDMEMDTELLESVSDLWKEKGVTHAEAQELANQYITNLEKKTGDAEEQAFQQREEDIQTWANETKADKEIGGDKLGVTLTNGRKALDAYGSKDLANLLESSGLGSNVHMVKFLASVGNALGDDDVPLGDKAGPNLSKTAIEDDLYGDTTG